MAPVRQMAGDVCGFVDAKTRFARIMKRKDHKSIGLKGNVLS
jgi:hypothetical protein